MCHSVLLRNLDIKGSCETLRLSMSLIYCETSLCCENIPENIWSIICSKVSEVKQMKQSTKHWNCFMRGYQMKTKETKDGPDLIGWSVILSRFRSAWLFLRQLEMCFKDVLQYAEQDSNFLFTSQKAEFTHPLWLYCSQKWRYAVVITWKNKWREEWWLVAITLESLWPQKHTCKGSQRHRITAEKGGGRWSS